MRRDPALQFILLLALGLRLSYLLQANATPLFEVLLLDSEFYDRQARALLAGQGWGEGVFFMNPLYPYFLALIYWVGGPSWWMVGAAQALLGALNCGLIFALGRMAWGRREGLVGAGLAAFYGVFIFYDGALLTATPILFFNLAALCSLLRWRESNRVAWLWGAGICLGLSALARPLVLLFAALLGGWFGAQRRLRAWGVVCLGCGLVLAPAMARNGLVGGEFALTTSSAGMNFYVGNNPQATGIYAQAEFVPSAEPDQEREGFLREARQRTGQALTAGQASGFWLAEGLRFIRGQPGEYLRLLGRKCYLFWNDVESQNNLSYYLARDWVPLLRCCALDWGLVAPLALAAWGALFNNRRETLFEWYTAAYLLGCLLFFVSSEYRLPVVPVLLLWAGRGLLWARGQWRLRDWRKLGGLALVVLVLGAGINHADDLVRRLKSRRVDYYNFGMLYERRGEYRRAEELVRQALAIDPQFAPGLQALARLQQRQELEHLLRPLPESVAPQGGDR